MSVLRDAWEGLSDGAKQIMDALSFVTVLGTIIKMLPAVAAFLSIVWTALRIWESKSVQRVVTKRRMNKGLQSLYQSTVDEGVPDEMAETLRKLK